MKKTISITLLYYILFLPKLLSGQEIISECVDFISGNIHSHLYNCSQDIVISSLLEDNEVTIVTGNITTSGVINIIPGEFGVKILPPDHPEGLQALAHAKSKIKTNGNGRTFNNSNKLNHTHNHNQVITDYLEISPNPAKNSINISTNKMIKRVYIYNIKGNIKTIKKVTNSNKKHEIINISHLESGIFILKVFMEDKTIMTKKLIKH